MRTVVIRVERPRGASAYSVRAEIIEGQSVLAKARRTLRTPEEEPVNFGLEEVTDLLDALLERLTLWHSEGVQLQLPPW